jgi:Zn ribbon nucleic-acid-binding protein
MANTFFIKEGLTPPSPYKVIDTLTIARSKFKFMSNKLDDLGKYLGVGRKVDTGGFKLWLGCLKGDKKSWKLMRKYNKQDVSLLEDIYIKLRGWGTNLPAVKTGILCPTCGSDDIQFRGWNTNKIWRTKRIQCLNCGKWSESNIKEKIYNKEYVK